MRTAAAVIITHNSEDVLEGCLAALAEFAPDFEVLVVDNASSDRSVEIARSRGARVIANAENRGFAAAANQGFSALRAGAVLLLNPDTHVATPLSRLLEACRLHGIAAGRLIDADGALQAGFTIRRLPGPAVLCLELLGLNRLWPGNPWNRRYRYLDRDLNRSGPVEQPAGAFLMIRRDVWERLRGFDEAFWPVWFEDVDFCRRAAASGQPIQYVAEVKAYHLGGHSIRKLDASAREIYWYVSLVQYAAKHFGTGSYRLVCLAAMLSTVPRMILGILGERSARPVRSYAKIFNFAGRRLVSGPHRPGRGTKE